jgi:hypothetical protein
VCHSRMPRHEVPRVGRELNLRISTCCKPPLLSQSASSSSEAELRALMAERRKASLEGDSEDLSTLLE